MKQKVTYEVQGMTCGGCQRSIVAALERAGVDVDIEDVSLAAGTVRVDAGASDTIIRRAIEDAGYDVGLRRDV
jgi:copper chaperone